MPSWSLMYSKPVAKSSFTSYRVLATFTWYSSSHAYADHDFHEGIKTFPNQSNYTIKFQFAPQSSSDKAYAKDISIFLEVANGMPALSS
jgi:hypothetical protein